jgi:hypothetical protein
MDETMPIPVTTTRLIPASSDQGLVPLFDLKFLTDFAASVVGTSIGGTGAPFPKFVIHLSTLYTNFGNKGALATP